MELPKYHLAADCVLLRDNKFLLIKRSGEPFSGKYEFPGGMKNEGEIIEATVIREAKEETGYDVKPAAILGAYTKFDRDPRGTMSVVFICDIIGGKFELNEESTGYMWASFNQIDEIDFAFDHKKISLDLERWTKEKGTYWSSK